MRYCKHIRSSTRGSLIHRYNMIFFSHNNLFLNRSFLVHRNRIMVLRRINCNRSVWVMNNILKGVFVCFIEVLPELELVEHNCNDQVVLRIQHERIEPEQ